MVFIWNGLQQDMGGKYRDSQSPDTVCLYRETAFIWQGLQDGLYLSTCLHELVGCKITDVAGSNGKNVPAEQGEFLVHHFLDYRRGKNAR